MVGPYNKPKESDGHYCSDHAHIPERFFLAGVISYDVGDHAKSGKDKDVDFRVTEESEEVLIKDRVPPSCRVEKGSIEVTVGKEYSDSGCQDW